MLAVRSPIAIGLLCLSVQVVSVFLVYVYHQSCSQSQKLQFQPCSCKGRDHSLHWGDFSEGMLRCLLLCFPEHAQGQCKGFGQLGQSLVLLHNKSNWPAVWSIRHFKSSEFIQRKCCLFVTPCSKPSTGQNLAPAWFTTSKLMILKI